VLSKIPEIAQNAYLKVKERLEDTKWRKDTQYNGNKGKGQNDKH